MSRSVAVGTSSSVETQGFIDYINAWDDVIKGARGTRGPESIGGQRITPQTCTRHPPLSIQRTVVRERVRHPLRVDHLQEAPVAGDSREIAVLLCSLHVCMYERLV